MSKIRSERARWVDIFLLPEPGKSESAADFAVRKHEQARAVIDAFQRIGRVVRVEPSKYGNGIVFKARRS